MSLWAPLKAREMTLSANRLFKEPSELNWPPVLLRLDPDILSNYSILSYFKSTQINK